MDLIPSLLRMHELSLWDDETVCNLLVGTRRECLLLAWIRQQGGQMGHTLRSSLDSRLSVKAETREGVTPDLPTCCDLSFFPRLCAYEASSLRSFTVSFGRGSRGSTNDRGASSAASVSTGVSFRLCSAASIK
jgi:hypothetical protein